MSIPFSEQLQAYNVWKHQARSAELYERHLQNEELREIVERYNNDDDDDNEIGSHLPPELDQWVLRYLG